MSRRAVAAVIIDEVMSESDNLEARQDLVQVYRSTCQAYKEAWEEQKRLYEARSLAIESLVSHTGSRKLEIDGKKVYAVKRKGRWYIKGESKDEGFVSVS